MGEGSRVHTGYTVCLIQYGCGMQHECHDRHTEQVTGELEHKCKREVASIM